MEHVSRSRCYGHPWTHLKAAEVPDQTGVNGFFWETVIVHEGEAHLLEGAGHGIH